MSIGTPGQSVKVDVDTGSNELWVNPDCHDAKLAQEQVQECEKDGRYNQHNSFSASKENISSSGLLFGTTIQYGMGNVHLGYIRDRVSIPGSNPDNGIVLENVQFGVATASSELAEGILGLGFGFNVTLDYNNILDELVGQGLTDTKAFSLALGNVDADDGGVIIFGGVDTRKFTGTLRTVNMLAPPGPENHGIISRYWVQMTSVTLERSGDDSLKTGVGNIAGDGVDNDPADLWVATPVILDSGSTFSYLPERLHTAVTVVLDGRLDGGFTWVSCSHRTSNDVLRFAFGNRGDGIINEDSFTIKVPLKDFILEVGNEDHDGDGDDIRRCLLGSIPIDDKQSRDLPLLGDTFLRSAYVVFDQSTMTVSMAQYANCGENVHNIPADGRGARGIVGECDASLAFGGPGESLARRMLTPGAGTNYCVLMALGAVLLSYRIAL